MMIKSCIGLRPLGCFLMLAAVIGCGGAQQGYQKAFDIQHSLTNNQCTFPQSAETVFMMVKQVLLQQGFTIESAELKSGIIKAVRSMQDKEDAEISYSIHASADVSEVPGVHATVSLAASQQTILHRATTTWWHLFWIIPLIPTGTEYQTLVIKEGNITAPGFYADFFNALKVAVIKHEQTVKIASAKAAEMAAKIKAAEEARAAAAKAEAYRIIAEKEAKAKEETRRKAAEKAAREKAEADRLAIEKTRAVKSTDESEAAAIEASLLENNSSK